MNMASRKATLVARALVVHDGKVLAAHHHHEDDGDDFDPATLPAMAEAYGCQVDFEGTAEVIERHGLRF